MSGLFDRLMDQPGDDDGGKSGGLTPLDIVELPAHQRRVMFALLRDKEAAAQGITQEALAEKLDHPDDLAATLGELIEHAWLVTLGDPPSVRYKVNFRRKRGISQGSGLWSALEASGPDDDSDTTSAATNGDPPPETPSTEPDDRDPGPRRPPFPDLSNW